MSTHNTLVLTPGMGVHDIIDWQTSITLDYQGKVDVLELYEETVSSPTVTMNIPAVIRLRKQVKRNKKGIKFSKLNLFSRDSFKCSYCGVKKGFKELNYDHVVPRVQGGKTTWDNVVASCYRCNTMKDGRTPEQANMPLRNRPFKPTSLPMNPPIIYGKEIPEEWKPYLPNPDSIVFQRTG